jgi:hypothetical protein
MPRRNDDYHGGGSGWRFSWRIDRLRKLHELGRAFELTEDSRDDGSHSDDDVGERLPDQPASSSE